jgi:hypothetical protein
MMTTTISDGGTTPARSWRYGLPKNCAVTLPGSTTDAPGGAAPIGSTDARTPISYSQRRRPRPTPRHGKRRQTDLTADPTICDSQTSKPLSLRSAAIIAGTGFCHVGPMPRRVRGDAGSRCIERSRNRNGPLGLGTACGDRVRCRGGGAGP